MDTSKHPFRDPQEPKRICDVCKHDAENPSFFRVHRRMIRQLVLTTIFAFVALPITMGIAVEGCFGTFSHHNTVSGVGTTFVILLLAIIGVLYGVIITTNTKD